MRTLIALLTLASATLAGAAEYERRLIPVTVQAPGGYGTFWSTRATAVQELEEGSEIIGDMTMDLPSGIGGSQPYRIFPPLSENEPPGAIMHVRKEFAHAIHISARLEQVGSAQPQEIHIPVVREKEFEHRTLYFAPLVRRPTRRMHLRVYSLDVERPMAAVRVRIQTPLRLTGWTFVYDKVHALAVRQRTMTSQEGGDSLPLRPYALELLLDPLLADIAPDSEMAVSIVPVDEGLRIWGILSETDNTTQQVRLVFGQ